jgi:DNA (cytosine-5)-methyltransferase 1
LGWKAQWLAEIEPFPCSLLAHHNPDTPNLGDMTKFNEWPTDDKHAIDLLCGGTPCQSFSVAGLRKGLDDPRGNLMLTFGAIAAKYRPQWLVWENVPGVLSSNGGRDFGSFLGMLGQLGYGFAYRVLDAQYFGVAQRRRRVFVVGCLGDWRSAAAVLFERHSLQGHPAPSRQAGKGFAKGVEFGPSGGGFTDLNPTLDTRAKDGQVRNQLAGAAFVPVPHADISPALKARDHKGVSSDGDGYGAILVPMLAHSLRGEGFDASEDGTGRGTPLVPIAFPAFMSATQHAATEDLAPSMGALNPTAVAFNMHKSGNEASSLGISQDRTDCLRAFEKAPFAVQPAAGMQVRRLTPGECESLQGFPQGYTNVPHRGKPAADGPRYKALGNSWAVPNVRWIGRRIDMVAALTADQKEAA